MSYEGMGASFVPTTKLASGAGSGSSRVNVGVDPSLVAAFRNAIVYLRDHTSPSGRAYATLAVYGIDQLRRNQWGKFDPSEVRQKLLVLTPEIRGMLDRLIDPGVGQAPSRPEYAALNRYTVSRLVADIDSGRFAGVTPSTAFRASVVPMRTMSLPVPPPPVNQGKPEVECTDGYARDAQGLCVPGAAPPVADQKTTTDTINTVTPSESEAKPEVYEGVRYDPSIHRPDGSGFDPNVVPPSEMLPPVEPKKFLGLGWKVWAGAAAVTAVAVVAYRSSRVTPNKRRKR